MERMTREQFFAKLAPLSEDKLQKTLWNLYWRGSATMRQRIETELEPSAARQRPAARKAPADPDMVLDKVRTFVSLAHSGAYIAGSRRVSPKERTRWRFTFRSLLAEARDALRSPNIETAAEALTAMIDLACQTGGYDYFRSEDPIEAAKVVVSDEVAHLWTRMLGHWGLATFADKAMPQLIRWESPYGWTRTGWGQVSERETTLAAVLAQLLPAPDTWPTVAERYLRALDAIAADEGGQRQRPWLPARMDRDDRTARLASWHDLLLQKLDDADGDMLDRLSTHPALGGPELTFLQARLAHQRGDHDNARALIQTALTALPGHQDFLAFAMEVGAHPSTKE
jgi:hypothetical protein